MILAFVQLLILYSSRVQHYKLYKFARFETYEHGFEYRLFTKSILDNFMRFLIDRIWII